MRINKDVAKGRKRDAKHRFYDIPNFGNFPDKFGIFKHFGKNNILEDRVGRRRQERGGIKEALYEFSVRKLG